MTLTISRERRLPREGGFETRPYKYEPGARPALALALRRVPCGLARFALTEWFMAK